jgi:hypothetical protein
MKIQDEGLFKGLSLSAFNQVKGLQHGFSFGIFNYARQLNGMQIGLLNYVKNNPKYLKILPIVNFHFD